MKKIQKYKNQESKINFAGKLASYTALASAFILTTPDVGAQCGVADAANPILGVDIDGDGAPDVNINWGSASGGTFASTFISSATNVLSSGSFPAAYAYAYASIPQQIFTGFSYFGCSLFSFGYGAFAGPSMITIGPLSTTATATASRSFVNQIVNYVLSTSFASFYSVNYAFASAAAGNQIIGLTAAGASACTLACGGGSTVGLGSNGYAFVATNYYIAFTQQVLYGSVPASAVTAMVTTMTTISGIDCTTSTASVFGGYYYVGPQLTLTAMATAAAPATAIPASTYTFPPVLFSTSTLLTTNFANTNPTTHLAVKFVGGDGDTYNGWVEISIDPNTSEVTCVDNGYNMCSIENANAVAGTADACPPSSNIAVGDPTFAGACDVVEECDANGGSWPSGN